MSPTPMRALRCTAIGECMIELRPAAPGMLAFGYAGDTYNTLHHLCGLLRGTGSRLRFLSALGDDELSAEMRAEWQRLGIETTLVQTRAGKRPGMYHVSTDAHGERRFLYWRGDSAARYALDDFAAPTLAALLRDEDLVYFSGISLAILSERARATLLDALRLCRRPGLWIAFDDNFRPALWSDRDQARMAMGQALAVADVALVSAADQQALWNDASPEAVCTRLRALGCAELVVRNGAEPGLVADGSGVREFLPERSGSALDTTGAGDAFNAAYLAARLQGCATIDAIRAGARLSARVVEVRGALLPPGQSSSLQELIAGDTAPGSGA